MTRGSFGASWFTEVRLLPSLRNREKAPTLSFLMDIFQIHDSQVPEKGISGSVT